MEENTLNQTAVYLDVDKLLHHTVRKFLKTYGGDYEDLLSESGELFLSIYRKYDLKKGKFPHYFRKIIWLELISYRRRQLQEKAHYQDIQDLSRVKDKHSFNLERTLDEVSNDAQEVARLVLDSPLDVLLTARQYGGEHRPKNLKQGVIEYLKDLGWGIGRISEAFKEIRESL